MSKATNPRHKLLRSLALVLCILLLRDQPAQADGAADTGFGFTVAGLKLGLDLEGVRRIHPAIPAPVASTREIHKRLKDGMLTLSFGPERHGGRLIRIQHDRPVGAPAQGPRRLLDRLIAQYGPYERILYRRKMEPAGRITGFEWRRPDLTTLRVILRNDADSNSLRLNILVSVPTRQDDALAGPID